MFWTLGWLWLLFVLGGFFSTAIGVFVTAKTAKFALGGLVVATAAFLGALYLIMQWVGPADGG